MIRQSEGYRKKQTRRACISFSKKGDACFQQLHLQVRSGKLILDLMITEGSQQKRQSQD